MKTDNIRSIIAHEMGHAIVGEILDSEYEPTTITLRSTKGEAGRAACNFNTTGEYGNTSLPTIRRLHNLIDLGGIFGELILNGEWSPWGASYDLEDFVGVNIESRGKLITELFNWMYNDEDDQSYFDLIRKEKDIIGKRNTTLTWNDTRTRLPQLWEVYLDFVGKIDIKNFKDVVVEIEKGSEKEISKARLNRYMKRIVRS